MVGIVAAIVTLAAAPPEGIDRLRARIQQVMPDADGTVGVAIKHLESGRELELNGDQPFPMASTFKLPVLVELYAKAKAGDLRWDEEVEITRHDQHLGSGELSYLYDAPGVRLSLHNVANLMMMISDNSAADLCLAKATAPAVNARMKDLGIDGIRVDRPCQDLILDYGGHDTEHLRGLTLDEIGKAISHGPRGEEARFGRDDRFAADPRDTATPRAFMTLLEKIWRGEAVDRASSDAMLATLKRCQTGRNRIRGLLPPSTEVAHKTGTIGGVVNDVGIIYLPDEAGHVAIAVLTKQTRAPEEAVEKVIAQIARYAFDYFYFTSAEKPSTSSRP
jgi:beta-lactamase class A